MNKTKALDIMHYIPDTILTIVALVGDELQILNSLRLFTLFAKRSNAETMATGAVKVGYGQVRHI